MAAMSLKKIASRRNNLSRRRDYGPRRWCERPRIAVLSNQRKKPIHNHFHAGNRRRDNPDYDQNQADKG
jgi:hypothetical protein